MTRGLTFGLLGLTVMVLGACGSDEAIASEDHTPVRMVLIVGTDTMTTDTLFLPAGQTVTVRGSFYNAADESLDDAEPEHWSKLTFTPGALATAVVDNAHHYSHTVEVLAQAGDIGSVDVGYGHGSDADEHTLSAPVKIVP